MAMLNNQRVFITVLRDSWQGNLRPTKNSWDEALKRLRRWAASGTMGVPQMLQQWGIYIMVSPIIHIFYTKYMVYLFVFDKPWYQISIYIYVCVLYKIGKNISVLSKWPNPLPLATKDISGKRWELYSIPIHVGKSLVELQRSWSEII